MCFCCFCFFGLFIWASISCRPRRKWKFLNGSNGLDSTCIFCVVTNHCLRINAAVECINRVWWWKVVLRRKRKSHMKWHHALDEWCRCDDDNNNDDDDILRGILCIRRWNVLFRIYIQSIPLIEINQYRCDRHRLIAIAFNWIYIRSISCRIWLAIEIFKTTDVSHPTSRFSRQTVDLLLLFRCES